MDRHGEKISSTQAGYEGMASQLESFFILVAPPFIYVNDPSTPQTSSLVVKSILEANAPRIRYAFVNAVECFTSRLLFDSILNALAGWEVLWENGCENWGDGKKWSENLDGFLKGMCAVNEKGKGREEDGGLVVVIERAERLKDTMPESIVPLTRLAELTKTQVSVIFLSDVRWEDIKPSLGASPDPYYINVPPPTKQATISRLTSTFHSIPESDIYDAPLFPLYEHFISVVYSICAPFTQDPQELGYVAAARWPGFVQPILDAQEIPPSEDTRMRLIRLFTPSLTAALEALYPRLSNAAEWARASAPIPSLLSKSPVPSMAVPGRADPALEALPRMSKYILVCAFLASTNPAKTDLRMFGRGLDERRKRKRGGGTRRGGAASVAKVPQRLLGPSPFPLDRLLAILGGVLEENDVESRPLAGEFKLPGEYTEMEIGRVQVYAAVMELTSMRLLHRTSPVDRLDGPPMFKCGISYDMALALARELGVALNDLMWDPA